MRVTLGSTGGVESRSVIAVLTHRPSPLHSPGADSADTSHDYDCDSQHPPPLSTHANMAAAAAAASASAVDALHVPDTLAELVVGRVYSTHILFMAHSGTMMAFWPSPTVDKRVPIAWSDAAKLCMANGVKVGSPEAQIKLTGKPIEVTFKGYADHTTLIPVVNPSRNVSRDTTHKSHIALPPITTTTAPCACPLHLASADCSLLLLLCWLWLV